MAVYQNLLATLSGFLDELECSRQVLHHVHLQVVLHCDLLIDESFHVLEVVGNRGGDVEDSCDIALAETRQASGHLSAAQVEMGEDLEGRDYGGRVFLV